MEVRLPACRSSSSYASVAGRNSTSLSAIVRPAAAARSPGPGERHRRGCRAHSRPTQRHQLTSAGQATMQHPVRTPLPAVAAEKPASSRPTCSTRPVKSLMPAGSVRGTGALSRPTTSPLPALSQCQVVSRLSQDRPKASPTNRAKHTKQVRNSPQYPVSGGMSCPRPRPPTAAGSPPPSAAS
jgi:hypothetical protein